MIDWPDLATRLAVTSKLRGLSQQDIEDMTGINAKTVSSFESGRRTHTIKLRQLELIVTACGSTLVDFLAGQLPAMEPPKSPHDPKPKPKTTKQLNSELDMIARVLARDRGPASRDYPSAQSSLVPGRAEITWRA